MTENALNKSRGFTLLEVLVAMTIVAIGLLGLAGLMSGSLKNNQSAYQRSQAVWLAYDILDRMRANQNAATSGNYNIVLNAAPASANPIALADLTAWTTSLGSALPQGTGSVNVNANIATVIVQWNDQRGLGYATNNYQGKSNQTVTIVSRL